jgi:hypothetical protein
MARRISKGHKEATLSWASASWNIQSSTENVGNFYEAKAIHQCRNDAGENFLRRVAESQIEKIDLEEEETINER